MVGQVATPAHVLSSGVVRRPTFTLVMDPAVMTGLADFSLAFGYLIKTRVSTSTGGNNPILTFSTDGGMPGGDIATHVVHGECPSHRKQLFLAYSAGDDMTDGWGFQLRMKGAQRNFFRGMGIT